MTTTGYSEPRKYLAQSNAGLFSGNSVSQCIISVFIFNKLTMGFEQLASLKDELARQAAAKKREKQQKKNTVLPEKKAVTVDPVVLIIGQLQKKFPLAFPKKPAPKVPLKIGIHKDLLEQVNQLGMSENELRAAIKTWCWGQRYWDCLVEDAVRVDLDGNAVGVVTKEEAQRTKQLKVKAKAQAKKAGVVKQREEQNAFTEPANCFSE